jgi:hypothetical protein
MQHTMMVSDIGEVITIDIRDAEPNFYDSDQLQLTTWTYMI